MEKVFKDDVQSSTIEGLESLIAETHYINLGDVVENNESFINSGEVENSEGIDRLKMITLCVLVLKNGFVVTGKSGCNDSSKYTAEAGQKFSRLDAISQMWALDGYYNREKARVENGY